jgi:hypothetical protein
METEPTILIDTDNKLCASIQAFLNKGFKTAFGPQFLTTAWLDIKGIEVFGKPDWAQLNRTPQEDILVNYILPKLSDANRLFSAYFSSLIPDSQSTMRAALPDLIQFASAKEFLIIPISDINFKSCHRVSNHRSTVLFKAESVPALVDFGIQTEEQHLFFLAHEIAHAVLHYYYQSGFKTDTKQSLEYILFNETMAWHVANNLLLQYCPCFNPTKLNKQQVYSLSEYRRFYSNQKNIEEYFKDTLL